MIPNFCFCLSDNCCLCLSLSPHTLPSHTENQYIKIVTAIISELNGYFVSYTFLNFTKSFILKVNF